MSLFLPKLQSKFAEFLQHSCLERLSILYSSTCVGLGYGNYIKMLFPEKHQILHQIDKIIIF